MLPFVRTRLVVHPQDCIRCASCASLAPALFVVDATASRVVRQPVDAREWLDAEAAATNCPTGAIGTTASAEP